MSVDVEIRYRLERAKWDSIAEAESADAARLPPYAGFEEYARTDSRLAGVAEFLGELRGKRVLEEGAA